MMEMSSQVFSETRPLKVNQLISYSGLSVPLQALLIPLIVFLPPFYATEMGLGLATVGAVFFVARLWDALSDPIVGGLSDRTKSRFGPRRPWIFIGTPFLMGLTWLLLVPQFEITFISLSILIFVFYVFWTSVFIPYQSWGAEITPDYDERARVTAFREGGTVIGILLGMGVPLVLIDPVTAPLRDAIWPGGLPLDNSLGSLLRVMASTVIVLLPVAALAACLFAPAPDFASAQTIEWRQTMGVLTRNKMFLRLFVGYFSAQLGFLCFIATVQLFVTRGLMLDEFLLLVFLQHVVAIVTVPAWIWASNTFGKHRAYCATLGFMMTGFLGFLLIPTANLQAAIIVFMFHGVGASGKLILPSAIAADTVDYDTLQTGAREAGSHLALLNLANKVTFALSVGITYPLLALAGFDPNGENSPGTINALMAVTVVLPFIVMSIGLAVMWNFPLTKQRHAEIRAELAGRQVAD